MRKLYSKGGFTLIELLIVVAIIGILAAIAIPNFLQAQVRSKVARVQSDMRTIAEAMEVYYVDHNTFPFAYSQSRGWGMYSLGADHATLTTPIPYLTSIPLDPFSITDIFYDETDPYWRMYNVYYKLALRPHPEYFTRFPALDAPRLDYMNHSWGPDKIWAMGNFRTQLDVEQFEAAGLAAQTSPYSGPRYDPTNGTISSGDILRHGGHTNDDYDGFTP